jgi:hypothetical protein
LKKKPPPMGEGRSLYNYNGMDAMRKCDQLKAYVVIGSRD